MFIMLSNKQINSSPHIVLTALSLCTINLSKGPYSEEPAFLEDKIGIFCEHFIVELVLHICVLLSIHFRLDRALLLRGSYRCAVGDSAVNSTLIIHYIKEKI